MSGRQHVQLAFDFPAYQKPPLSSQCPFHPASALRLCSRFPAKGSLRQRRPLPASARQASRTVQPATFRRRTIMLIGKFTKTETSGFRGVIHTLTLNAEVTFEPITDKTKDQMPDFRLSAGDIEIGAAWKKSSEAGTAYLSVNIDDPSLPAPIQCAMVKTGAEHGYSLVWERRRKAKGNGNSSEF